MKITVAEDRVGRFVYKSEDGTVLRRSGRKYGFAAVHNYPMCTKFQDDDIRAHLTFHATRAAAGKRTAWGNKETPKAIIEIEAI